MARFATKVFTTASAVVPSGYGFADKGVPNEAVYQYSVSLGPRE
jgi:hypothetical protein